jgi:hypothetical protein
MLAALWDWSATNRIGIGSNASAKQEAPIIGLQVIDLYEIPITLQATSSRKNMRQVAPHRGNTGTDDGQSST